MNLSTEKVQKAIHDILGNECQWFPNGSRCEGYSIIIGQKDFWMNNMEVERLRLRLNTLDRMENGDIHTPLAYWKVSKKPSGWELRFIEKSHYHNEPYEVCNVRLYDCFDGEPHDGEMKFAAYLFHLSYNEQTDGPVKDLVEDFVSDSKVQYMTSGQEIYDYISKRACTECNDALQQTVDDYLKYCEENQLKAEPIKKDVDEDEQPATDEPKSEEEPSEETIAGAIVAINFVASVMKENRILTKQVEVYDKWREHTNKMIATYQTLVEKLEEQKDVLTKQIKHYEQNTEDTQQTKGEC